MGMASYNKVPKCFKDQQEISRLMCGDGEKRAWYTLFAHALSGIWKLLLNFHETADYSHVKDACN